MTEHTTSALSRRVSVGRVLASAGFWGVWVLATPLIATLLAAGLGIALTSVVGNNASGSLLIVVFGTTVLVSAVIVALGDFFGELLSAKLGLLLKTWWLPSVPAMAFWSVAPALGRLSSMLPRLVSAADVFSAAVGAALVWGPMVIGQYVAVRRRAAGSPPAGREAP